MWLLMTSRNLTKRVMMNITASRILAKWFSCSAFRVFSGGVVSSAQQCDKGRDVDSVRCCAWTVLAVDPAGQALRLRGAIATGRHEGRGTVATEWLYRKGT